jgi:hypothetical protein
MRMRRSPRPRRPSRAMREAMAALAAALPQVRDTPPAVLFLDELNRPPLSGPDAPRRAPDPESAAILARLRSASR